MVSKHDKNRGAIHRLPEHVAQKEEETDTDQSAYQIRVPSSPVMDHRQDIVDAWYRVWTHSQLAAVPKNV
jgi:hypothetical protein